MGTAQERARLPTLKQVLADGATVWQAVTLERWYGASARRVELASDTCVWYHAGLAAVPIRWVLVRDPEEEFDAQAFSVQSLRPPHSRCSNGSSGGGRWK